MKNKKDHENKPQYLPIYMSIGPSLGMAIGVCLGVALDAQSRKKENDAVGKRCDEEEN